VMPSVPLASVVNDVTVHLVASDSAVGVKISNTSTDVIRPNLHGVITTTVKHAYF